MHECTGSRWDKFSDDELSSLKNALAENIYCQCDSNLLWELETEMIRRWKRISGRAK
jgi:hypothetical protein